MGCSSSIHAAAPTAAAQATQQGATKPQPVTADSRLLRGQAYYAAGKVAEALKELNATIATWPTYARAYLERGNIRLDQRDYTLAVGDYTMALQLQGNLLQAYMMRCHARMAMRQYAEALQDARDAERLDPENAQVKALKAQVRKAQAGSVAAAVAAAGAPNTGSIGSGGGGEEEDAFAGLDTPKSTPSPSVRKVCMVCMDAERECRLRPCMHAALCVACAEGLMARGYGCPICSSKIEQVERGSFMRTFTVEEAQGIVASARVVAPLSSPGKSPLGRRFVSGPAPVGPSLDNIVEGDEEGHTSADVAIEAAAMMLAEAAAADAVEAEATLRQQQEDRQRRLSGGSAASSSGRLTERTVMLDPHPLAGRSAAALAAAAGMRNGSEGGGGAAVAAGVLVGEGDEAAEAEGPPPPLPGEVVPYDYGRTGATGGRSAAVAEGTSPHQSVRRTGSGTGDAAAVAVAAVAGTTSERPDGGPVDEVVGATGDADAEPDSPPPALTAVASTLLANSLADWIDEHSGDSPGRPAAAATSSRALLPTVVESELEPTAAGAAESAGSGESFSGFGSGTSRAASVADAAAAAAAAAAEIEVDSGGPEAEAEPAANDAAVSAAGALDAAPASAGPVAEGHWSRPGSAVAGSRCSGGGGAAADPLAGRSFFYGSGTAGSQRTHLSYLQRRATFWSARSLAAAAAAAAGCGGSGGGGSIAEKRPLSGAYASCGAAAAAARPFSRHGTAYSGRHPSGRSEAAPLPPPPSPLGARSARRLADRARRAARGGSGDGGGGGDGGGTDPWDLRLRQGDAGEPEDPVVLLPGAVPP